MLVLTRKQGEVIAIGDDIKVIIVQIKGKQVKLGIQASPNTIIHREEIFQRIHAENKLASQSLHHDLTGLNPFFEELQKKNEKIEKLKPSCSFQII